MDDLIRLIKQTLRSEEDPALMYPHFGKGYTPLVFSPHNFHPIETKYEDKTKFSSNLKS